MIWSGQIYKHQVKLQAVIIGKSIGGSKLANIKSQIKRNKQNREQRLRNRVYRGTARTFIKKAQAVIKTGDKEKAKAETLKAIKALDKAAAKGVIHKNNAARRKARLMNKLNSL